MEHALDASGSRRVVISVGRLHGGDRAAVLRVLPEDDAVAPSALPVSEARLGEATVRGEDEPARAPLQRTGRLVRSVSAEGVTELVIELDPLPRAA
jgi:hypothetical protein